MITSNNPCKPAAWFALGALCATIGGGLMAHVADTVRRDRLDNFADADQTAVLRTPVGDTGEVAAYWDMLARRTAGSQTVLASAGPPPLLPSTVTAAAPWEQMRNDLEQTASALNSPALNPAMAGADPAVAVQRAAWTLMQAELLSDPSLGRVETAWPLFAAGLQQLDDVAIQLNGMDQSQMQTFVTSQPQVAMMFDAVMARHATLVAMQDEAFNTTEVRLNAARSLMNEYRLLLGHLAAAERDSQLNQIDMAEPHFTALQEGIARIKANLDAMDQQHTEFLFEPEPAINDPNPTESALLAKDAAESLQTGTDVRVLQALSLLSAAERAELNEQQALLVEAHDLLSNPVDRESHPLAEYVFGRIQESRALTLTATDPTNAASRQEADRLFDDAVSAWERATGLLSVAAEDEPGNVLLASAAPQRQDHLRLFVSTNVSAPSDAIVGDIEERLAAISNEDQSVRQVWDLLQAGQTQSAWQLAEAMIQRHSSPEAWDAYFIAGLHAEVDLEILLVTLEASPADGSVLAGMDRRDYWTGLVFFHRARESARGGDHEAARSDLERARRQFESASIGSAGALDANRIRAACLVYQIACQSDDARASQSPQDRQTAINELMQAIGQLDSGAETIEHLETLALAYHMLGQLHLDAWDSPGSTTPRIDQVFSLGESLTAQVAAHRKLNRLPFFRCGVDVYGGRLLDSLAILPSVAELRELTSELNQQFATSQRHLSSGMLQGAFGHQAGAGAAYQDSRSALLATPMHPFIPAEPESESPADWLEQLRQHRPSVFRDETIAFSVLQEHPITGLGSRPGLLTGLDHLLTDALQLESGAELTPEICRAAVDNVTTPLRALTCGWLLHSKAVTLSPEDVSWRQVWIDASTDALDAADRLMTPEWEERYPALAGTIERLQSRISSPAALISEADELRERHEYSSSLQLLDEGLHIHHRDIQVWLAALDLYETVAARNSYAQQPPIPLPNLARWRSLLAEHEGQTVATWQQHYLAGRVAELTGDRESAAGHFNTALDQLHQREATPDEFRFRDDILSRTVLLDPALPAAASSN